MDDIVLSDEAVERGYNNRAAVPGHPEFLARYIELSTKARARYRPQTDLRYGNGPKETLDLYLPSGQVRGTFVFIHGGYWRALDKSDFQFVAGPMLARGLAVAVVNYDLCPDVTIAAIVDEIRRALVWLVQEGPRHGSSADNIVVAGHSAGGHLAAMMHVTDWSSLGLSREPFVGSVSLSGVHDLVPIVQATFNSDLGLDVPEARRVSPINHALHVAAPLLIAVGGTETSEFLRQARLLWDAWPSVRLPASGGPFAVPDKHHFSVVLEYADADSELTRQTQALFRAGSLG